MAPLRFLAWHLCCASCCVTLGACHWFLPFERDRSSPQADASQDGPLASVVDRGAARTLLFAENFKDDAFAGRGWKDGPGGTISSHQPASGRSCLECRLAAGEQRCAGGTPRRRPFSPVESIYVSFDIKLADDFALEGPNLAFCYLLSTLDPETIGPHDSHFTGIINLITGCPSLALEDNQNVDGSCVLLSDGSIVGCDGDPLAHPFSEERSAFACNTPGEACVGGQPICVKDPGKTHEYKSRCTWSARQPCLTEASPSYKGDWHRIEAHLRMNSLRDGQGLHDGVVRLALDGRPVVERNDVLLRTGQHPGMKFSHLLFDVYGPSLSSDRTLWIDELRVETDDP